MLYLLFSALIVIADQIVKRWAVLNLKGQGTKDFIPGILNLYYAENTGAAFSILRDQRWIFIIVSILASLVMVYIVLSKRIDSPLGLVPLSMVLGGAVGNLIDRIYAGFVVDMFEFAFIRFAIFNVADIFITVGGVLFCVYYLYSETKNIKKQDLPGGSNTNTTEDLAGQDVIDEGKESCFSEGEENI
jgi:signal peptidase II